MKEKRFFFGIAALLCALVIFTGCPMDGGNPGDTPPEPPAALALSGWDYRYDSGGLVQADFTFNKTVQPPGNVDGWVFTLGGGDTVITATQEAIANPPGGEQNISFTVTTPVTSADGAETLDVCGEVIVVAGLFHPDAAAYTVEGLNEKGAVKLRERQEGEPEDPEAVWYYAPPEDAEYRIFDAVYTPNKDVAEAAALFTIKLDPAGPDIIYLSGTVASAASGKTIHLGKPGGGNGGLPGFIIEGGALDGNASVLQANPGACLDIRAAGTLNASVYVKAGSRVRGPEAWPLGASSLFTVESGGYLAIGPNAPWLIGAGVEGGIVFGGANEGTKSVIYINETSLLVDGAAIVREPLCLSRDLWLSSGSVLTVEASLGFLPGEALPRAIYGRPKTAGGLINGGGTTRPSAKIVVQEGGLINGGDVLGGSLGPEIGPGVYIPDSEPAPACPFRGYSNFCKTWAPAP